MASRDAIIIVTEYPDAADNIGAYILDRYLTRAPE